jgi:lysophospholipase L1-like esterase
MITPLPQSPSRGDDADQFVANADAFIAALPRFRDELNSFAGVVNSGASFLTLGYSPPVIYAAGIPLTIATQTVQYDGNTYAPKLADLPFTTSGAFEAAKFRLIQGVIAADLATPTGADQVGFGADSVADVLKTLRSDPLHVLPATYAEPNSRLVVGAEYLYAFQHVYRLFAGDFNESHKILWSGDSTTAGDLAGDFPPSVVSQNWARRYGLINIENINVGHSGYSASHWVAPGGYLDQDLAAYPGLRCYVLRWGINDAAGGIAALEANMRNGLSRIRAIKGVKQLSILLMSPNVVSHDPSGRNESWNEQVSKLYKRLAREFKCCFIDTYALWRDARAGVGAWLDDPYADGTSGVHPDATMNHIIVDTVAQLLYRPLSVGPAVSNTFTNTSSVGGTVTLAMLPNDDKYHPGISMYRTDPANTWPFSGSVVTTRTADGIVKQELIGYEGNLNKRSIVRYGVGGEPWSEWRGLLLRPDFVNGWTDYGSGDILSYHKSMDGTVFIEGRIKNASALPSTVFTLPVGFRPIANLRVICHNYDTSVLGSLQIQMDGPVVFVSAGTSGGNDVNFRCFFKAVF